MSAAMDKALMAMSLEDEDVPFIMPELPQFSSCERNILSLIGRILNPDCQTVSGVIHSMPRKWQKSDRIRGVALSKEKFQFIFKSEHDLEDVLQKGFQTYNEWGLVIERWAEIPPPDSLQFVLLWVQIRNIPINFYTDLSITALGEIVGQVIQVAYDPSSGQSDDFVRVQVRFDVSKPLRKGKLIGLPKNQSTEIRFFYERVQKRCYNCQRLSHEKDFCPIILNARQAAEIDKKLGKLPPKIDKPKFLAESDPLFGVLREDQVGIHPVSGRPRIALDVLEGMRQYLMVSNGEDRILKEERVRKSVGEAEKSPITQKTVLSLEPAPVFTLDVNKGKGLVFGYSSDDSTTKTDPVYQPVKNFLASVLQGGGGIIRSIPGRSTLSDGGTSESFDESYPYQAIAASYKIGGSDAGPSKVIEKKNKPRKRQSKTSRKAKGRDKGVCSEDVVKKKGAVEGLVCKRKAAKDLEGVSSAVKAKIQLVVPIEGLSNI